ncbi:MAG: serine/threonine-protein kinase [Planctomycetota bacterium]
MRESEIFEALIEINDPETRQQKLVELCGDDLDQQQKIQQLIDAHDAPTNFVDDPVGLGVQRTGLETHLHSRVAAVGSTIGPYKLLQQIGEGGMGVVYMAEQSEPIRRRVALKIIKPGMDSRQVIARFEAERQALAMMDHPNIAKVLDAGTTEFGYPFFVMELVNGIPITDYCDQEQLTPGQRLQLFLAVCQGVQHAHQKGIIHRDLKPSNILVTEYDGAPAAKIIDFGVAKALASPLTEKTLFTEFGQVIGTIEYMSPEQARRNQLDIDTRSDIYSLGIVLYQLLTGETPFGKERFQKAAWEEMLKIILDEQPPMPSLKINSSAVRQQIAKQRGIEAGKLASQVKGDLDWIVLKSLEKDRAARYATVQALADDIRSHLHSEPIKAGPHTWRDRTSRFLKRNWRYVLLGLVFLAIAIYLGNLAEDALDERNNRVINASTAGNIALENAIRSPIGNEANWDTAALQGGRVSDALESGIVSGDVRRQGEAFLNHLKLKKAEREIAIQIEEVIMHGASEPDLASWQQMEQDIRDFFRKHGFDLDQEEPLAIGERIRDDPYAVMWSDLLELWIGTRGQMATIGGPKITAATMQPWAEAIYVADTDPVRTAIRKFIYQQQGDISTLQMATKDVELETLSPRTLSWLASCYAMVQDTDEAEEIYRTALRVYPQDVMLNFDFGYLLASQNRHVEATRIIHRCLVLRGNVPGFWKRLATSLTALGETQNAKRAMDEYNRLKRAQDSDELSEPE